MPRGAACCKGEAAAIGVAYQLKCLAPNVSFSLLWPEARTSESAFLLRVSKLVPLFHASFHRLGGHDDG
jgi:hypothetical protein